MPYAIRWSPLDSMALLFFSKTEIFIMIRSEGNMRTPAFCKLLKIADYIVDCQFLPFAGNYLAILTESDHMVHIVDWQNCGTIVIKGPFDKAEFGVEKKSDFMHMAGLHINERSIKMGEYNQIITVSPSNIGLLDILVNDKIAITEHAKLPLALAAGENVNEILSYFDIYYSLLYVLYPESGKLFIYQYTHKPIGLALTHLIKELHSAVIQITGKATSLLGVMEGPTRTGTNIRIITSDNEGIKFTRITMERMLPRVDEKILNLEVFRPKSNVPESIAAYNPVQEIVQSAPQIMPQTQIQNTIVPPPGLMPMRDAMQIAEPEQVKTDINALFAPVSSTLPTKLPEYEAEQENEWDSVSNDEENVKKEMKIPEKLPVQEFPIQKTATPIKQIPQKVIPIQTQETTPEQKTEPKIAALFKLPSPKIPKPDFIPKAPLEEPPMLPPPYFSSTAQPVTQSTAPPISSYFQPFAQTIPPQIPYFPIGEPMPPRKLSKAEPKKTNETGTDPIPQKVESEQIDYNQIQNIIKECVAESINTQIEQVILPSIEQTFATITTQIDMLPTFDLTKYAKQCEIQQAQLESMCNLYDMSMEKLMKKHSEYTEAVQKAIRDIKEQKQKEPMLPRSAQKFTPSSDSSFGDFTNAPPYMQNEPKRYISKFEENAAPQPIPSYFTQVQPPRPIQPQFIPQQIPQPSYFVPQYSQPSYEQPKYFQQQPSGPIYEQPKYFQPAIQERPPMSQYFEKVMPTREETPQQKYEKQMREYEFQQQQQNRGYEMPVPMKKEEIPKAMKKPEEPRKDVSELFPALTLAQSEIFPSHSYALSTSFQKPSDQAEDTIPEVFFEY